MVCDHWNDCGDPMSALICEYYRKISDDDTEQSRRQRVGSQKVQEQLTTVELRKKEKEDFLEKFRFVDN